MVFLEATLRECAKNISLKERSDEAAEYEVVYKKFLGRFGLSDVRMMRLKEFETEFLAWATSLLDELL